MKNTLNPTDIQDLFEILQERFHANSKRHEGIEWEDIQAKLGADPQKLYSVWQMEQTGGEPDVVLWDKKLYYIDCSPETPKERRSICYDREALDSRKTHKPHHSAVEMAKEMGIELLTEEQYFALQNLGKFDQKTSSWLRTPSEIRQLKGAIFGDRRYERVFIYHNGAESYYASRGFRGILAL